MWSSSLSNDQFSLIIYLILDLSCKIDIDIILDDLQIWLCSG
jgi:hypothetical protein